MDPSQGQVRGCSSSPSSAGSVCAWANAQCLNSQTSAWILTPALEFKDMNLSGPGKTIFMTHWCKCLVCAKMPKAFETQNDCAAWCSRTFPALSAGEAPDQLVSMLGSKVRVKLLSLDAPQKTHAKSKSNGFPVSTEFLGLVRMNWAPSTGAWNAFHFVCSLPKFLFCMLEPLAKIKCFLSFEVLVTFSVTLIVASSSGASFVGGEFASLSGALCSLKVAH